MDQKTWIRMKKSLEKSIPMNDEAEISVKGNEEEKFPYEKKAALEETVKNLHEQVACLLCECNVKDKLMAEHVKTAQKANTGREKAEAEVVKWKRELEGMLQQKVAANERLVRLNAALKNCRQQLSSSKVEHDRRVNIEREHKRLESKYTEARKKLANLTVENARLTKALVKKEEIIEDVNNQMSEATAEFNALISRLDFTERGNDVLKYEYRVLERELKMRNRRADVAKRQHQESAKNVAKLEAERQKLRLLVRRRIPGHAKTKPSNHPKAVDKRKSVMIKRLCEVEEENKILKESESKREKEIRLLKAELTRKRCGEQNIGIAMQHEMIRNSGVNLNEKEKEELVSVDAHSSDKDNLDMAGKKLVPQSLDDAFNSSEKDYDWLQHVLLETLEHTHDSKRSFDEVLEDIRIAFQHRYHASLIEQRRGPINKLDEVNDVHKDLEAKLLESENRIVDLKTELKRLKESKRMTEDHFENLKLINVDLDHQLFAAKLQIKEALRKVSFLEMELEDRSHHFEGLEAACLELQLQLARYVMHSVSHKDVVSEDFEQEGKSLQTITAEMTNNKKSSQHTSLRDRMAADDGIDTEDLLNSSMIKEIITTKETKEPTIPRHNTCNTSYGVKNVIPRALSVVPSKQRRKGIELLRKLLYRRKRGGNKKKLLTFATNRADLIRNKDGI
ncbi:filament-like plant protein 7 isoform X2 [Cynara cardunculus var. scolymus]|uniref:filament-like plant protein 7 isoform X2 n=1 Tax=Cynara cardunculus var. scolymus TaxID=59895 RepID=UPI000D62C6E5|nr:filament-like plant protein 7 isoform X2 [Cynara cardunculus var. scolymus]